MKCYMVCEIRQYWTKPQDKAICQQEFNVMNVCDAQYEVVVLGVFDSVKKSNDFRRKLSEEYDKHPEVEEEYKKFYAGSCVTRTVEFDMNVGCTKVLMKEKLLELI